MNTRKFATLCFTAAIFGLCLTIFQSEYQEEVTKREQFARLQYNTMLLSLMQGGIPAVTARCILETKHIVDVYPCSKAASPKPGREL